MQAQSDCLGQQPVWGAGQLPSGISAAGLPKFRVTCEALSEPVAGSSDVLRGDNEAAVRRSLQTIAPVLALLAASTPSLAQEPAALGRDSTGLPGIQRVGVWQDASSSLAVAGTAGYGYTEAITQDDAAHHRGAGSLGVSISPTNWLALGLRLDGRFDSHASDGDGRDTGMVGDPWLIARAGNQVSDSLALGAELGVWVPGQEAPSVEFGATTVEGKLLVALISGGSPLLLAGAFGFRLDRSAKSAPDAALLRQGDRIALGISDFNAALIGVGFGYRLSNTELLAEVSADVLLGADDVTQSPLRAGAGVRHHLNDALQLEGFIASSLSSRPDVAPSSDLIPIEPRVLATLGFRYVFDLQPPVSGPQPPKSEPGTPPPEEPKPKPKPKAVSAPVTGIVTDEGGTTLAQVNMTLITPSGQKLTGTTDDQGRYRFNGVPFGEVTLRAETADFAPRELKVNVGGSGDQVELAALKLKLAQLTAQIQGLVRSFQGQPLQATIRIEPLGKDFSSGSDGRFAIDVEPGTYTVSINADGYKPQTRTVLVPEKGVIVFNADLRRQ